MKKCSRCGIKKEIEEFNYKNKKNEVRDVACKICTRTYLRIHYERNKTYYLLKARKRNKEQKDIINNFTWNYLKAHPCVDCGEKDPIVLEFDHRSDKISAISRMSRIFPLEAVKHEIEKCDVRCANCHRRKTALEGGWYKNILPL